MNIHLTEDEFKQLSSRVILSIKVGSHLYGLTNKDSDTDILNIYALPEDNLHSLIHSHHQFQYKGENTDFLFCSVQSFVKNILMGDSTLNFEALDSLELKAHEDFKFLASFKPNFVNYQLIKSYLGLARRDIKMYKKDKNSKKLFHAFRGYLTAEALFNCKEYFNDFSCFMDNQKDTLKSLKQNQLDLTVQESLVKDLVVNLDALRSDLNVRFDRKEIVRVMSLEKLTELEHWVISISKKYSQSGYFENAQYLDSIQSEITYEV